MAFTNQPLRKKLFITTIHFFLFVFYFELSSVSFCHLLKSLISFIIKFFIYLIAYLFSYFLKIRIDRFLSFQDFYLELRNQIFCATSCERESDKEILIYKNTLHSFQLGNKRGFGHLHKQWFYDVLNNVLSQQLRKNTIIVFPI